MVTFKINETKGTRITAQDWLVENLPVLLTGFFRPQYLNLAISLAMTKLLEMSQEITLYGLRQKIGPA